uniref:Uncharacterized protein n=1 Tax=Nelumbo nucifera TaxID=4432 RepID=A0A822ZWL8_NELNU|nr:TPA_asm: hypothetical protein HUJ06_018807 [Nelumbo nucifera]
MDPLDDEDLRQVGSRRGSEVASTDTGASSLLSTEDSRSITGSSDISVSSSSSSSEIPTAVHEDALVPRLVGTRPSVGGGEELTTTLTVRERCVGRNNKGMTWGFTSIIGRRREMEDTVAVIPGFMSRTCGLIGGCTAPGSRSSGEISPVHFFGVYDGHGGSQEGHVAHSGWGFERKQSHIRKLYSLSPPVLFRRGHV